MQSIAQMTEAGHQGAPLMIKNIPDKYNLNALLVEIVEHCDLRDCDMLHLPFNEKRRLAST